MPITLALKNWLVDNCSVEKDATDDEFKKAAGSALAEGTLSAEKLTELITEPKAEEANEFGKKLDAIIEGLGKVAEAQSGKGTGVSKEGVSTETESNGGSSNRPEWYRSMTSAMSNDGSDSASVRVKGAWEQYDDTKTALMYPSHTKKGEVHPSAGRPVMDYNEKGRVIHTGSDLDDAIAGAFAKFQCSVAVQNGSRSLGFQMLPDHDKDLMFYALEHRNWGGATDGGDFADIDNRKLTPAEQKTIVDDGGLSGGTEAAPIVFDDKVIQTPLLHGELFPLVNVVNIDRGRRIEGVSIGTVTSAWGGVDDTAITLFDTDNYISAFNTTIFRWEGAIKIGRDFISDTPIDFGAIVTEQYGQRLLEDLDTVIATGNGTTQPEGIMNKAGVTDVNFGGTSTIGNYETMRFTVLKPEHQGGFKASAVFCGNELSYQRVRGIPVGTTDARRLGGMDYDSYSWMQRPYKINESLDNNEIFYVILKRYRMYKRRGFVLRRSTEGQTLLLENNLLIAAMARYGGQLERTATAALTTTGEV